jgi:hypothetical protein
MAGRGGESRLLRVTDSQARVQKLGEVCWVKWYASEVLSTLIGA